VRWQYDEHHRFVDYGPDINAIIEEGYKSRKPEVTWEEDDGEYKVIFRYMSENRTGGRRRKVQRNDLRQQGNIILTRKACMPSSCAYMPMTVCIKP
jgi:hypothetical protein